MVPVCPLFLFHCIHVERCPPILSTGAGNDYVQADADGALQFGRCDRRRCFSIGIVDNDQLEEDEVFDISLFRNGLDRDILLGLRTATITITDDDSEIECKNNYSSSMLLYKWVTVLSA